MRIGFMSQGFVFTYKGMILVKTNQVKNGLCICKEFDSTIQYLLNPLTLV